MVSYHALGEHQNKLIKTWCAICFMFEYVLMDKNHNSCWSEVYHTIPYGSIPYEYIDKNRSIMRPINSVSIGNEF